MVLPNCPDVMTLPSVESTCNTPEADVTVDKFLESISEIDTTQHSGCLEVPMRIYRIAMCAIPELFAHFFNMSITNNIVPSDWKKGLMTPLCKKRDSSDPADVRPITITRICGKILEAVINRGLYTCL